MNRYRQEVATMDRRYRQLMRVSTFAGAALLAFAALWSARVPLQRWLAERDQSTRAMPEATLPSPSGPTVGKPLASIPAAASDTHVPATPQPLQLVSTSPGRSNREGTARLGIDPRTPQTYAAGSILANGAQLIEIYPDRVVLQRENARLTLFVDPAKNSGASPQADLAVVGGPNRSTPATARFATDALTEVVRSMPFYENDLLAGMQIFAGQKATSFAQLGLQSGDVITSLDGAPIGDWQAALDQLHALLDGAALTATVRRGGQIKTITLDGSVVIAASAPPPALQPDLLAGAPR
jgi:hypothetical protein